MTVGSILTRRVDVAHLPSEPVTITADDGQRARLATEYDLLGVGGLTAEMTLTGGGRGSVTVEGRVIADIEQACVVSLVPVPQHIDETFSLRFVRPVDAPPEPKPGADLVIDPDRPDPPEILDGPSIDVGALAEEAFALAIDPYPRAPDASLPPEASDDGDGRSESPFAALAALTGKRAGKS